MLKNDQMKPFSASYSINLNGTISLPGDKSISHRAIILGGLAKGKTIIHNLLESDDVLHSAQAMRDLGALIEKKNDRYEIIGTGNGCLLEPDKPLYFGNSGTGVRLIMGLVSSYFMEVSFTGDPSLSKRPMRRVTEPLSLTGAQFHFNNQNTDGLPLTLHGAKMANAITYELPVASAQVKSAILFAALNCHGTTKIIEKIKTRDHSEIMLPFFGVNLNIEKQNDGSNLISCEGGQEIIGQEITIAGDPSSAAFLIVAALITKNSDITIKNHLMNENRIGLLKILLEMNANIEIFNKRSLGGEIVADIRVKSSNLKALNVPAQHAPSMIDEYPIAAIAAAYAEGETTFYGLEELRVKESDRLSAIALGLKLNGVECHEGPDFLKIRGNNTPYHGGTIVPTFHDHRIAMSFLVMGLTTKEPITIDDSQMINTSFPQFIDMMKSLGANFIAK